jgi:phosphoglycerate dehydrogenase-like enzyme
LRDFVDLGEFFMGDVRVAVLDDYWKMAQGAVDWMGLDVASVDFFHDTLIDPAEIIDRLLSYEVLVTTRERTRFSAEVLAGLPNLKLIAGTGGRQANVDMEKATQLGIEVMNTSGSRGRGNSTAELAWAL